jgi:Phytanoyl-CoA dioxygenase (PhyH)
VLSAGQIEQFNRDGYLIVRDVFSPDEARSLRETVYRLAREGLTASDPSFLGSDLSVYPELCNLIVDERLVEISRQLVGDGPVYYRDSAVNIGGSGRGWHKDNRNSDRCDLAAPDWDGRYPLLRMGIYLEDHAEHSGGLALRVGSHVDRPSLRRTLAKAFWSAVERVRPGPYVRVLATGMLAAGRPIHAGTRLGDVVVWNLRTTHSARTLRLKVFKQLKLPVAIENRVPSFLALPEDGERVAAFISYGASSAHLSRFIEYLLTRGYFGERTSKPPCAEFLAASAEQDLTFIDPAASPERAPVPAG